jgi:uroporphyrinogen-III synthase
VTASVLVLRPRPGADETVDALRGHGIPARALPVLELVPRPETPALRELVQRLDEFDVVVFVSPAAVRFGMKWIDAHWPQYPVRTEWLAVGERSRQELASWSIRAGVPERDETAEGLLDSPLLQVPGPDRVLLVRGEGGRELLADELATRGIRVEHLVVHERRPLQVQLPPAGEVSAMVASSVAVVDALVATGGLRLAERPLIVPSERVAAGAREAGFTRVRVAAGAGAPATRRALAALGITDGSRGGQQ